MTWSAVSVTLLGMAMRLLFYGASATYATEMKAAIPPNQGIAGSPHDLSRFGPNHVTASSDACVFCHSPHGKLSTSKQLIPVWNHATTQTVFTMYTSPTLKGTVDAQPTGESLACLSCHDGTLAMGTLNEPPPGGGETDYTNAQDGIDRSSGKMVGGNVLGNSLAGVHPIAISYQDDLVKTLRPANQLVGVKLYPSNKRGAKVQCGSCHDPHNFGSEGTTAPFLRVSKVGSGLCLACHNL
jgi:predicted CXXCH cytochrome family protein